MLSTASDLDSLRRLARYDAWANCCLAEVLRDAHERPIRFLAHAAESERVWLRRIAGTQPASHTADFWPEVDADGCRALVAQAADALGAFVDLLDDDGLEQDAVYHNSKGAEYRTPVADVLTHVFLHSHYHRGQAATALRALDVDPPWTDFIAFARTTRAA
ncbi:MAG: DinB family protein [Bacteroidota bacterium]